MGQWIRGLFGGEASRRARASCGRGSLAIPVALLAAAAIAAAVGAPALTSAQTCSQVVKAGIVRAEGCFTQAGSVYTATQTVDLNGIQMMATPDSRLTINTETRQVSAKTPGGGFAPIKFAIKGIPSDAKTDTYTFQKLDFAAPNPQRPPQTAELVIGYAKVVPRTLAGLSPVGTIDAPIKLVQADAAGDATGEVAVQYSLPGALMVRGTQATASVVSELHPNIGAVFDGIEISASELTFRNIVGIRTLEFTYRASQQLWAGELEVAFPTKKLSNPDVDTGTVGAKATVQAGQLREFGISFGVPIEIFPQVYFTKGSVFGAYPPVSFGGSVDFRAGEEIPKSVPVIGGNRMLAGSIGLEYRDPAGNPGKPVQGLFALRGGIDLFENIRLASAEFQALFYNAYTSPPRGQLNSMSLRANVGLGLPRFTQSKSGNVIYIGGGINGWWEGVDFNRATGRYARSLYNFEGNVRVSLLGWDVTGAQAVFSNRGIAACVKPIWWSPYIGAGYAFRSGFSVLGGLSGCGLSPYRETSRPTSRSRDPWARLAHRRGAGESEVLDLEENEQTIRIEGTDDVPSFDLESSEGERIRYEWNGESPVFGPDKRWVILGDPRSNTAFVLMRDPEGEWAITDTSPETEIEEIGHAKTLDPPAVEAEVTGKGLRKRVSWNVEDMRPNDKLRLYETLGDGNRRRVFTTARPEGTRRFVSALGPDRRHGLRGIVTRKGAPFEDRLLDEFTVREPRPPAPPRGLRAHRLGTRVSASWDRAPDARGYVAVLENEDGSVSIPKVVSPRSTKVVFRRAPIEPTMRVKVYATGRLGFPSRPAVRRFEAVPPDQSPGRSVGEMLRSVRVLPSGNLGFVAPCPGHGHCTVSVDALRRGEAVGSARATVIPESRRRLRLRLPEELRAELREGEVRRFRLRGELSQAGRAAERGIAASPSR